MVVVEKSSLHRPSRISYGTPKRTWHTILSHRGMAVGYISIILITVCSVHYCLSYRSARKTAESFPWSRVRLEDIPRGIADPLDTVSIVAQRKKIKGYARSQFGRAWTDNNTADFGHNGCDTRDDILQRDLVNLAYTTTALCSRTVLQGELIDPYTARKIFFIRGKKSSSSVQIDHLIPLSYAWDMGASTWPEQTRVRLANDPRNLLAVYGPANVDKGDKPPGTWQPSNAAFRCQYNQQFAYVVAEYHLTVETATANAIRYYARLCA